MKSASTAQTLTLYELGEEQIALDQLYAMDDGESTPETEQLEQELIAKLASKADSFGAYLRDKEARCDILEAEITRLAARKRALANQVNSLKTYGLLALQTMNRPKIEGTSFTLALQNNPPKAEITASVDTLPEQYVRTIPARREIDRVAILDALKNGVEIPGCEITRTQHLRVR